MLGDLFLFVCLIIFLYKLRYNWAGGSVEGGFLQSKYTHITSIHIEITFLEP